MGVRFYLIPRLYVVAPVGETKRTQLVFENELRPLFFFSFLFVFSIIIAIE